MTTSIYLINKGINKPLEFKGLRAQYILYMAILLVGLMAISSVLYLIGFNQYVGLVLAGVIGAFAVPRIFKMSSTYGEHGLTKLFARKAIPGHLKSHDRDLFIALKQQKRINDK